MTIWFVALSGGFCALSAAILVYFVMQSRHEVLMAEQRESLSEARATLEAQKQSMVGALKSVEETTRRTSFDQFLSEIRVEERHYLRENKMLFVTRKSVVVRERIFFRNIPLSSWVEHEIPYEEGADIEKLARTAAVFSPDQLLESGPAGDIYKNVLNSMTSPS
jgi:hypothetical protein